MSNQIRVGQAYYPSKPHGITKKQPSLPVQKPFQHWLQDSLQMESATKENKVNFSQHALQRLQERGIQLAESELKKLDHAVQKAADKGAKESLILMNQIAYVVNIANRKVITAVDPDHMKDHVFTNIDSAVLA